MSLPLADHCILAYNSLLTNNLPFKCIALVYYTEQLFTTTHSAQALLLVGNLKKLVVCLFLPSTSVGLTKTINSFSKILSSINTALLRGKKLRQNIQRTYFSSCKLEVDYTAHLFGTRSCSELWLQRDENLLFLSPGTICEVEDWNLQFSL